MRVWVTRDEPEDGRFAQVLREAGLEPVSEPVLRTTIISDVREAISQLDPNDWLVLTSERAIEAIAIEPARVPRVAVVGERSAQVAAERGLRVAFISPTGESSGLWQDLAKRAADRRVCYPRSSLARIPEPDELPGITLDAPVIYTVEPREFDASVVDRVDVTAFTSTSAVNAVQEALGHVPQPCASIGPHTSEALRQVGVEPDVEAQQPTFESLANAIRVFNAQR